MTEALWALCIGAGAALGGLAFLAGYSRLLSWRLEVQERATHRAEQVGEQLRNLDFFRHEVLRSACGDCGYTFADCLLKRIQQDKDCCECCTHPESYE